MTKKITGIYAPIPTPFNAKGQVHYDHLASNLERWGKTKLSGIVVMGSNGEFVSLTHSEKVELMGFVRKYFNPDKKIIAGTGCESAYETIELNNIAAEAGLDAVLVLNPTYFKGALNPESLTVHFTAIADASPLPVMLYNMPGNSSYNMPSALTVGLSKHPNIVGIKDSSANIAQITEVIASSKEDFCVFAGSGSFLMPTLVMGGCGGTLAVANVAPDYCVDLYEATLAGDYDRARKMQYDLMALNAAVTSKFGIAGLKAALSRIGFYGGPTRLPILSLKEEALTQLYSIMDDFVSRTEYKF